MLFPCLLINIFRVIVVHLDDTIMVFGSKNNNLFFAGKASPQKTDKKRNDFMYGRCMLGGHTSRWAKLIYSM